MDRRRDDAMDDEKDDRTVHDSDEKKPGLVERVKKLYRERPVPFALAVMGLSVLALVAGSLMVGDGTTMAPGPFPLGG